MVKEWNLTDMVVDGKLGSGRAFSRDELPDTDVARFEARVDRSAGPDACHPWTGSGDSKGYGTVWIGGGHVKAHRVAYVLAYGFVPAGLVVRHRCDNPPCCNPRHLTIGSVTDNVRDRTERGRCRVPIGEEHYAARLTEDDVNSMRRRARQGASYAELGREYGTDQGNVRDAVTGHTWKSASEPPVTEARQTYRWWTEDEDAVILATFAEPAVDVAERLDRTVMSVNSRRRTLRRRDGLTPAPRRGAWTEEDDAVVLATLGEPVKDVAERLGRSYDSVTTRRHALRARQGVAA